MKASVEIRNTFKTILEMSREMICILDDKLNNDEISISQYETLFHSVIAWRKDAISNLDES